VIVGAPNVGKSSLMNILLNEERAIVTNIPGTTRDYLEGSLSIKGVPITLVDTAGIRESRDKIEQIGVERVFQKIENSDLIIFLIDETHKKDSKIDFSNKIKEIYNKFKDKKHILVQNKSDIKSLELKEIDLKISTKNDIGIKELKELIYNNLVGENFKSSEIMITNNRHKVNIDNAINYMQNSLDAIENMLPLEFVSQDLKFALNQLGAILGEVTPDDILGNIFGNFCIGK
jgi:tRNA modification GTPase